MTQRANAAGHASVGMLALAVALSAGPAVADEDATLIRPTVAVWGYSAGIAFDGPRGVAFDPSDGALYVANTGAHRIEVFSKTGRPLARFVHRVSRDTLSVDGTPTALAFDKSGHLLVADNLASYVDVLDRRGRPVTRMSVPAGQPSAIAVAADGSIYVGTAGEASRVYRFRRNYTPDGAWGEPGADPGHLHNVYALAVLPDSTIAVVCGQTDLAVQIFSAAGDFLRGFGSHEVGDGNFSLPSGLAVTADGRLWVLDEIRQSLQVFDREGRFAGKSGGGDNDDDRFAHPSSLASDGAGLLAVTDRDFGRARVFSVTDQ